MTAVKLFANTVIFREKGFTTNPMEKYSESKCTLDFSTGLCVVNKVIHLLEFSSMKGKAF